MMAEASRNGVGMLRLLSQARPLSAASNEPGKAPFFLLFIFFFICGSCGVDQF